MADEPGRLTDYAKRPSLLKLILVPMLKGLAIGLGIIIMLIYFGHYLAGKV